MAESVKDMHVRVGIAGAAGVGVKTLARRVMLGSEGSSLLEEEVTVEGDPTQRCWSVTVHVDGDPYFLELVDATEESDAMLDGTGVGRDTPRDAEDGETSSDTWDASPAGFDALIVAFSLTDRYSFSVVPRLCNGFLEVKDSSTAPIVIVATKADDEDGRMVDESEWREIAMWFGVPALEVSSMTGDGISSVLRAAVGEVLRERSIRERGFCILQ